MRTDSREDYAEYEGTLGCAAGKAGTCRIARESKGSHYVGECVRQWPKRR